MQGAARVSDSSTRVRSHPVPADWSAGAAVAAELPRVSVDTVYPVRTGRVLRVSVGQQIQPAIDSARYGDEIVLAAGGVWVESITLRAKTGAGWIVLRSDAALPTGGQRVRVSGAANFAKILAPNNSTSAIYTAPRAAGWRLVGLEVGPGPAVTSLNSLIRIGDGTASVATEQANRIVLDRLYIHGTPTLPLVRCVQLHAQAAAVLHSIITECHHDGQDSQAIVGWNGPGPYLIANNYLAGAGENIMFGGAVAATRVLPSDITIVGNHITKPAAWRGKWLVKNLLEIKVGIRILIAENVIENVWTNGQVGNALVLKSSWSPGMDNFAESRDITIRSNIIRNAAFGAIALAASPEGAAVPMSKITVVNNLITRLGSGSDYATSGGRAITVLGGVAHLLVAYNTMASPDIPLALWNDGNPPRQPGFTLRGNVIERGIYGLWGSGGEGMTTVNNRYTSATVANNVFYAGGSDWAAQRYPASTAYFATPSLIFCDWAKLDLRVNRRNFRASVSWARSHNVIGSQLALEIPDTAEHFFDTSC